ncbi:hypothetical protein FI667_g3542, partial [Globisporangium splendens]
MLDDEARHALEEEAIALVNLSNPGATASFRRERMEFAASLAHASVVSHAPHATAMYPTQEYHRVYQENAVQQQHTGVTANGDSSNAIHPLLQIKANLIARRDGKIAATGRKLRIRSSDEDAAAGTESDTPVKEKAEEVRKDENQSTPLLSMDVYVNGAAGGEPRPELKGGRNGRNSNSSMHKRASTPPVATEDELYAQNPVLSVDEQEVGVNGGNISMKSLLVTLKKRKLNPEAHADNGTDAASKLPSFRDVFKAPQPPQAAPGAPNASASVVASQPGAQPVPTTVLSSAEMKCKYRTGKCSNVRALKSCGDYHNLCNYHRLRANANQRKLDRKKKVQRQQISTTSSGASSPSAQFSSVASPASVAAIASSFSGPSSVAAAAALASLPTSLAPSSSSQQRFDGAATMTTPFYAAAAASTAGVVASLGSNSSSSSLRVKQETDACSY